MPTDREPKLFGHPRYEVERLAEDLRNSEEQKQANPGLYEAAMKLLKRRQSALSAVLKAKKKD